MIDISDTGKFIAPILLNPEKYNGKSFTCATAFYTGPQLAEEWTNVLGRKVSFVQDEPEWVKTNLTEEMREQLKKALGLMDIYSYFGPTGKKDLEWTLAQMDEKPTSWEDFLKVNGPWLK
jgi:hypothetical protein